MQDTRERVLPRSARANARRHCFNLERLRKDLRLPPSYPLRIDGPFRTLQHNRDVGGASDSRHMHGDATDHFITTVDGWVAVSRRHDVRHRVDVVRIAETIFPGVGNETSGTLHLDSRPGPWVRFVTWVRT
jgi:hypothetical protein